MPRQPICSRCESPHIWKLPPNQITKNPGFTCKRCKLRMRHSGNIFIPLLILIIASAVLIFTLLPWLDLLETERLHIGLPIGSAAVACFAIYQMFLPGPKWVNMEEER